MSLNLYDTCPCGSTKKIKFCKCKDHLAEMDKVKRMIDGEQFVAALEYINTQLKLLPSEPWLLAFKCDVLLRLGEIESLEETSAKFIRLQPDNPLAKLNRAMVALIRGSHEEAASLYLQAINAASLEPSTLLLTVLSNLIDLLAANGMAIAAMQHLELAAERLEGIDGYLGQIQARLVGNNNFSLLFRDSIPTPPPCDDEPFAERYRESIAMLYSADVSHAKNKLESIQREFGPHPALSLALLHCKLYLADADGAAESCLKLAADQSLADAQRAYFFALAVEVSPQRAGCSAPHAIREYEVEDEGELESKLLSAPNFRNLTSYPNAKATAQQVVGEEVPPRLVGELLRELDDEIGGERPKSGLAMVAIFGRQTDKPARLLVMHTEKILPELDQQRQSFFDAMGLSGRTPTRDQTVAANFGEAIAAPLIVEKQPTTEEEAAEFGRAYLALARSTAKRNLTSARLPAFNGKSVGEAAGDPAYRIEVLGVLLNLLAGGRSGLDLEQYRGLHAELNVPLPKLQGDVDGFDYCGAAYYYWADLPNLEPNTLIGLARSALIRQHVEVFAAYRDAIQTLIDSGQNFEGQLTLLQLQFKLALADAPGERLGLLEELYTSLRTTGQPAGQAGVAWFQELARSGRHDQASRVLQRVVQENENDPVVREFVYMLQMQMEQTRRGGAGADPSAIGRQFARRAMQTAQQPATAEAAGGGSGLWTPDQGAASAAPQSAPSSGGSNSGLWLPGQ